MIELPPSLPPSPYRKASDEWDKEMSKPLLPTTST